MKDSLTSRLLVLVGLGTVLFLLASVANGQEAPTAPDGGTASFDTGVTATDAGSGDAVMPGGTGGGGIFDGIAVGELPTLAHLTYGRVVGSLRTIVRLPGFDRSARGLLGSEEEAWLDNTLARQPTAGAVIRGSGGVRKVRVALSGRGKRGGARVIYYYHAGADRVFLIRVYPKNRKEDLTGAERQQMRRLAAMLKTEL